MASSFQMIVEMDISGLLIISTGILFLNVFIQGLAKAVAHFTLVTYDEGEQPNFTDEVLHWSGVIPARYVHLFIPYIPSTKAYSEAPDEVKQEARKYALRYIYSVIALGISTTALVYFVP